jgi:hypothetical protein
VDKDGSLLNDMIAQDLTVRVNERVAEIESLTYGASPRRILFVVDTSRKLPSDARLAEARILEKILSSPRKEDSFGLITAGEIQREVHFAGDAAALLPVVKEIREVGKQKASQPLGVLDAMDRAIDRFGKPQPGDALIVLAWDIEHNNFKANYRSMEKALYEHRVRAFAFLFGPYLYNVLGSRLTPPSESLLTLAVNSGGTAIQESADHPQREYQLTNQASSRLQKAAWQMYGAIAQMYTLRLRLDAADQRGSLELQLAKELRESAIRPLLLYPHEITGCGQPAEDHP